MTLTPIQVFQKASELGLKLGFEAPDTLTVELARLCPAEFASVLKAHKPALLALLRLSFVMVFSEILGERIFFCEDEDSKTALIEAGAQSLIYTRDELQILISHNRAKPFVPDELCKLAEIKRAFNGRITHS